MTNGPGKSDRPTVPEKLSTGSQIGALCGSSKNG
jgi:hypothetical protein